MLGRWSFGIFNWFNIGIFINEIEILKTNRQRNQLRRI